MFAALASEHLAVALRRALKPVLEGAAEVRRRFETDGKCELGDRAICPSQAVRGAIKTQADDKLVRRLAEEQAIRAMEVEG